jgi:DNA polymerase V
MIALIDCNAFFCSCERLFRPDLWKTPVGVLSNNDGCFVSRTKELKALGVKMGQPYFQVRELCEKKGVAVFSSNFSLYTNISDRVMSLLKTFAPEVEVYSVDEAFLDWSGFPVHELEKKARELRLQVWREVGIPVSVGIGATKVQAKLANNHAKKHEILKGVCALTTQAQALEVMKQTAVGDLWGVGARSAQKFELMGIKSAFDFCLSQNERRIQKVFTKVGRMLQDELRGIRCFTLNQEVERKQEINCSRSFGESVNSLQSLEQSLAHFVTKAASKLRAQKSLAQGLAVYFRTSPFRPGPQHEVHEALTLSAPTQDTRKLIKLALEVARHRFRPEFSYKKAGVCLFHFHHQESEQLDLFCTHDSELDRRLMQVVDLINRRDGPDTMTSLACDPTARRGAWRMRQESRSPRYVTGWQELPRVGAGQKVL